MAWLFSAYAAVWIIIFAYVFNLHRKQKALATEVAALRIKISE